MKRMSGLENVTKSDTCNMQDFFQRAMIQQSSVRISVQKNSKREVIA